MFDTSFYQTILPSRVVEACTATPEQVPVVWLHLGDGTVLDICHFLTFAEQWFAVMYFRDTTTCAEMDTAFVPYPLVMRVTVSFHHPETRPLGFDVTRSAGASSAPRPASLPCATIQPNP